MRLSLSLLLQLALFLLLVLLVLVLFKLESAADKGHALAKHTTKLIAVLTKLDIENSQSTSRDRLVSITAAVFAVRDYIAFHISTGG